MHGSEPAVVKAFNAMTASALTQVHRGGHRLKDGFSWRGGPLRVGRRWVTP